MHGIATSADGTRLAYQRCGESGPTLVIVTGAIQHRAVDPTLAELAHALSDRLSVVVYDRRGRGDSGDVKPYAVEREIDDIAALLALRDGESFLFGHSSGAVLAIEAARAGLPVARLAVYEPPLDTAESAAADPAGADYLRRLEAHLAAGRNDDALAQFMVEGVGMPPEAVEHMKSTPVWSQLASAAPSLPYDHAVMDSLSSGPTLAEGRWASATQPTLVLSGDASMAFMTEAADLAARSLPNARRLTLAGQGHGAAALALEPVLRDWFVGVGVDVGAGRLR